jgi:HEAT repeat protein
MRNRAYPLALALALTSVPLTAEAKLPKDLKNELQGYITELETSQNDQTKQAVAMTRGWVVDRKAASEALASAKADPKLRVRVAAAFGLMQAGDRKADEFVTGQLKAAETQLLPTLEEVVSLYPDKAEEDILDDVLDGAAPPVARDVLRYLVSQRGELWELYEETLRSGKHRKEAMQAALASRRPELLEPAKRMMKSKKADDRRDAALIAIAVSRVPGKLDAAKPLLYAAVDDSSATVVQPAAERLLELGDAKGAKPLVERLANEEPAAQALTLAALLEAGVKVDAKAIEPLKASENADVKLRAHQLLASEKATKKWILDNLSSVNPDDRLLALQAAGYTDSDAAAKYLAGSLFEGRADIRRISAEGLARLGKPVALDRLKTALEKEPDLDTRLAVIEAIGAIGTRDAVQVLRFKSKDRNEKIKLAVVDALVATGRKDAVKALDFMTRERNAEIQWAAFMGMVKLDYDEAKKKFDKMFRNPGDGFIEQIDALTPPVRKRVYEYLLTENKGAPRDAALVAAMRSGEFDSAIHQLAMDDNLLPKVRRQILLHLADRGTKKDLIVLENVARKSIRKDMAHLSAWLLNRRPSKDMEATYRGFLLKGDEVMKAIGMFGLGYVND